MATGKETEGVHVELHHLFPIERLTSLTKWKEVSTKLESGGFRARPLELGDYERGYVDLLRQLTVVGNVSIKMFKERFAEMCSINKLDEHYIIVVIENKHTGEIVGCSTLFLEYKIIHECSRRGRLEDVAVLDTYRGRKIGELLVSLIVELAREAYKCYKITLDCTDELKKFYLKNNFIYGSNMLEVRFSD